MDFSATSTVKPENKVITNVKSKYKAIKFLLQNYDCIFITYPGVYENKKKISKNKKNIYQ